MNDIIIFGAGKRGRKVAKILPHNMVTYFADNNSNKVGSKILNIPVISYDKMLSLCSTSEGEGKNNYDILLSVDSQEMRYQLASDNVSYWEISGSENNYFMRTDVIENMDKALLEKYLNDSELMDFVYLQNYENWFREIFYSEENKRLVNLMKNKDVKGVSNYLDSLYSELEICFDEFYENRPGMRLVRNILMKDYIPSKTKVCDLACGHGELLKKLKSDGFIVYGVEASKRRVDYMRECKIECENAFVDSLPFDENSFDIVVCQECLEHIMNPMVVVQEMKRVLVKGGMVFCTVPYGRHCDSKTHIRQFDESKIYSLFKQGGFDVVNIIRLSYLNDSIVNNNLFLAAKNDN